MNCCLIYYPGKVGKWFLFEKHRKVLRGNETFSCNVRKKCFDSLMSWKCRYVFVAEDAMRIVTTEILSWYIRYDFVERETLRFDTIPCNIFK